MGLALRNANLATKGGPPRAEMCNEEFGFAHLVERECSFSKRSGLGWFLSVCLILSSPQLPLHITCAWLKANLESSLDPPFVSLEEIQCEKILFCYRAHQHIDQKH